MTSLNTHRLGQHPLPETSKAGAGGPPPPLAPAAHSVQCLNLFRQGHDTFAIAKRLGISEAKASKLLWVARSREKGLPADYLRAGHVARIAG